MDNSQKLITKVKEKLGEEKIACLANIFISLDGFPPEVNRREYRKHNIEQIDYLEELESSHQLLRANDTHTHYRITPYVLLLINNPESLAIQDNMEAIFQYFKEIYVKQDIEPITFKEIKNSLEIDETELKLALYYLCETGSVYSGKDQNFPNTDESYICINERVIRIKSVQAALLQYFEWHYTAPQEKSEDSNINTSLSRDESQNRTDWYRELDDKMAHVVDEIDTALQAGLRSLSLMGIRALIEALMLSCIGEDKKSFKKNLDEICKQEYISRKNADFIYMVIDAGSAVIHRGHIPSEEDVCTCVEMVKNLMEQVYIIHPKLDAMSKRTPKRG